MTTGVEKLREEMLRDTTIEMDRILALEPDEARRQVMLLSLEREQVAAIAYSEDLIADRIGRLPVSSELRDILRRAVLWVHRDEALHAQFLRGALLRSSRTVPPPVTLARQAVGAVGGWVSAVGYHNDEEEFGLRSLAANVVLRAGHLIGKVPKVLIDELAYDGFARYCALSMVLEDTAVFGYEAMMHLVPVEHRASFIRMLDDERRHAALFKVLHESFDSQDQLRHGLTEADLIAAIADVSEWFLPREHRSVEPARSAFGHGSPVWVARSASLEAAVEEAAERGGLRELVSAGDRVAIRTTFMMGYDRRDLTSIVTPEVLHCLARLLRRWGAADVAAIEAPTVYDRFFANRSVHDVAAYFGFDSDAYRIVDADTDVRPMDFARGMAATSLSSTWLDADVRISLSKLRGDPTEIAHLTLPSMAGIGGRHDTQVHTDRLIDHRTAVLMALDVAPPDFAFVDAWGPLGDGPIGVMGCDRPSHQDRIYAGADALSVDITVLRDLGFDNPLDSEILKRAEQWFGALPQPEIVGGEPGPFENYRAPQGSLWYRFVNATAAPVYFHLSGHGRLFVPAMDETAFPATDNPGLVVRSIRRAAQKVFGLHPG